MYNYATGCAAPAVPYGWAPPAMPLVFGAEELPKESLADKTKRVLGEENSLLRVKNGYLLGAAVLAGLGYYGYVNRWF